MVTHHTHKYAHTEREKERGEAMTLAGKHVTDLQEWDEIGLNIHLTRVLIRLARSGRNTATHICKHTKRDEVREWWRKRNHI